MAQMRVVAAVCLLLSVATPAAADHGDIHPTLRTEQTYFHCLGDDKLQNIPVSEGNFPGWDTNPPARSLVDGGGCGYYENLFAGCAGGVVFDADWRGTFNGNLNSITADLYNLHVSKGRAVKPSALTLRLRIDGNTYFEGHIDPDLVHVTPAVPDPPSAVDRIRVTFTNIGLVTEDGNGVEPHNIELRAGSAYEVQSLWLWDASEVPAGLTMNPATPSGTIISVGSEGGTPLLSARPSARAC